MLKGQRGQGMVPVAQGKQETIVFPVFCRVSPLGFCRIRHRKQPLSQFSKIYISDCARKEDRV